jgi:lipopolysaccharide export system permease protein
MMVGRTIFIYFARRFTQTILSVFISVFMLIYTLDFVELLRRTSETQGSTAWLLAGLSILRVPSVTEQIIPFAVLFGSLIAFLNLNRRMELVITRAAGVSAWQFGLPAMTVAGILGLLTMMAYNPLAAQFKRQSEVIEAKLFGRGGIGSDQKGVWIRQKSVDGDAVIRAENTIRRGTQFGGITVFAFYPDGRFMERVEAATAELKPGYWQFLNAKVLTVGTEPVVYDSYLMATSLTAEQVNESLTAPESVSFWELPSLVQRLELAGLDATRYRLKYQSLLARPMLLIAMVLVAASVSLRFFRFGGIARMVLGGVVAGFVLYMATEVAEDLGSAGLMSAVSASWAPAVLGSLMGVLALLHQEDG